MVWTLAPRLRRRPEVRIPGSLDAFELAVRAIPCQQVGGGWMSPQADSNEPFPEQRCPGC